VKVAVEFPPDFERDKAVPIPLGRLDLAGYVGRLFFDTDGKMRLAISRHAVESGAIVLWDPMEPSKTQEGTS
jgi:hypothetical protein